MVTLQNIQQARPEEIKILANNPLIAQNLRDVFPSPYSIENAIQFLELDKQALLGHVFGVYLDQEFTGIARVVQQGDVYRNNAEIGYWLGQPFWGKGLATATVKLLLEYAFDQLKLYRVFAGVFEHNKASMKVLEKNGFVLEAIQKSAVIKNGKTIDDYVYRILRPDWEKLQ